MDSSSPQVRLQHKIPTEIQYPKIAPKGFPCLYKQWINDPLTGNKTWAHNDIVRWNFMNSKKGTFDPYRSFIEITVSVSIQDLPVGLLQIDNSAHSFINQMVLYSNNRQIQRITQYSTLLAYLNDIGMNQFLTQGRQAQGLGYGSFDTMPFQKAGNNISMASRSYWNNNGFVGMGGCYGIDAIFPTIGNNWPIAVSDANNNPVYNASKMTKGHITNANPIIFPYDCIGGWQNITPLTPQSQFLPICIQQSGYANNFRSQYYTNIINGKYIQAPYSIPNWQTKLDAKVSNGKYPFKFSKVPYIPTMTLKRTNLLQGTNTASNPQTQVCCSNYGYQSLFSPFFTKGTFQPFISPTVPQTSLLNGVILPTKIPILRRKFKIPLASAVMGCLIDPSSYCLIPLQSINDVLLQLTLDQYAMFTSGYNDVCELDDIGMGLQQRRCWNVQRLQYKLHTYFFIDDQIQQHIKSSLYQQIVTVNSFWSLGNQYQIQGGTLVNNTYIVGCSSTHLNQIVCLFVSNDYQKYSFCRKHYRLSNNIRRYWSKLAVDYWPPQPFKGNGGNVCSNALQDDNVIFIQNLYWANNYMFSKNHLPRINSYNFAINCRPYDPTNVNTFYDPGMLNTPTYNYTKKSINSDTSLGMPYIHQNRCVGKAAYLIPYTPFIAQTGLLQGINVSGLSNFEVVFQTDSTQVFPRDQTLYIFCKSSVIVKYNKDGIITIGR